MVPAGYGYQHAMRGGMMMPTQGWGVMPQQHFAKSTAATRQSVQRIRKRSDGKITYMFQFNYAYVCVLQM